MSKIFVNLPVVDLNKSIAFYAALGFTKNLIGAGYGTHG
jgi:predicted lactoylglutathione lyase